MVHIAYYMFPVASIVGVAAATTAAASSVIGGLAAGTATGVGTRFLKIGDMIKRRQPISPMEQRCRKDFLVEKCKEVHERNKEVVKGEIDRVSEEKRGELENVKVYMEQGIRDLQAPEHVLNKLCKDLKDISRKIKGIRGNIDVLHW